MKSEGGKRGKLGNGAQRLLPAANSSLPTQAGKYRNDQIEDDLESKTQNRSDKELLVGRSSVARYPPAMPERAFLHRRQRASCL